MAVLLVLGGLFLFIGQQDDIGVGGYSAAQAFLFVLLNLPQQAWELLPIAALIGSLLGLGSIARGSEITVMRATGMSPLRIAVAASVAAVLLIVLEVVLGEFMAPPLQQVAKQQKAFSKFSDVSFGGGGGAWVRDGDLILNVTHQSGERQFGGMQVFELSTDHRLRAVGHADRATPVADRVWLLRSYAESRFTSDRVLARTSGERRARFQRQRGIPRHGRVQPRQPGTGDAVSAHQLLPGERTRHYGVPVRFLVAHRAHGGNPLRRPARDTVRAGLVALGRQRGAHPGRPAARRRILPDAAPDRERHVSRLGSIPCCSPGCRSRAAMAGSGRERKDACCSRARMMKSARRTLLQAVRARRVSKPVTLTGAPPQQSR